MKMPTQATAVQRTATPTKVADGIVPAGGVACKLCDFLPEPARTLCRIAAC